jgi:hypothetical protein
MSLNTDPIRIHNSTFEDKFIQRSKNPDSQSGSGSTKSLNPDPDPQPCMQQLQEVLHIKGNCHEKVNSATGNETRLTVLKIF